MELLYYISGILSVGIFYGIKLLKEVKKSHSALLEKNEWYELQYNHIHERLNTSQTQYLDILKKIEEDKFITNEEISGKIKVLETFTNDINSKVEFANKANDKNMDRVFKDFQQLKVNVQSLRQDPNFLSRY